MKSRILIRSFLCVLAICLALGVSAPPSAHATSECLGDPTEAVQDWKLLYPCCFDDATCRELCGDWVKSCNDYAQFAFVCIFSSTKEFLDLEKRVECRTLSDKSAKKACEAGLKSDQDIFTEMLRDDWMAAKDICDNCFNDCLNFCRD